MKSFIVSQPLVTYDTPEFEAWIYNHLSPVPGPWTIYQRDGDYRVGVIVGQDLGTGQTIGACCYPFKIPYEMGVRLAERLNGRGKIMWHKKYNEQALKHFTEHGTALNQAKEYWQGLRNPTLAIPEVVVNDEVKPGQEYYAVAGLFHLTGAENNGNHHMFFDVLDENGNRLMGTQVSTTAGVAPVEKLHYDPGGNIAIYGNAIHVNGIVGALSDQVENIHTLGPNDERGNFTAHHSHYLVMVKAIKRGGPSEPEPIPDPDPVPPVDPPPQPEPEPETSVLRVTADNVSIKVIGVRAQKSWFDVLEADNAGIVTFDLEIGNET